MFFVSLQVGSGRAKFYIDSSILFSVSVSMFLCGVLAIVQGFGMPHTSPLFSHC